MKMGVALCLWVIKLDIREENRLQRQVCVGGSGGRVESRCDLVANKKQGRLLYRVGPS